MKPAWIPLLLLGAAACRRPAPVPTFEARLDGALPQGNADYRDGFRLGGRMVAAALHEGRRPYLPVLDGPGAGRPSGPLPPGMEVVAEVAVEVDPATGLELRTVGVGGSRDWARGQADGFRWALAAVGDSLRHPVPVPVPPAEPGAWSPLPGGGPVALAGGSERVEVWWREGLLGWRGHASGFAPIPRWRRWEPGLAPTRVAAGDGVLWVEAGGQRVAVDLDLAAVRAVVPGGAPAPAGDPMAEDQKARAEAAAAARPALLAKAQAGDAAAMVELGQDAEDSVEEGAWYRKAAEAGSAEGMYLLAVRCYQGRGVPEDRAAARTWFQRAAKAGHSGATEALAGLFPGR